MPPRIRSLFATMSVTLFLIAAIPLYTELTRPSDIWWTPRTMLVSLAESTDRVEIYARGQPLAALLQSGQVRVGEDATARTLAPSEIGLRFNNWDRVRAERLPMLLVSAAASAIAALMFLLIATGRLAYRGEREAVAA